MIKDEIKRLEEMANPTVILAIALDEKSQRYEETIRTVAQDALKIIKKLEAALEVETKALDEIYNNTKCAKYNSPSEMKEEDWPREHLLETYHECYLIARKALEDKNKLMEAE